MQIGEVLLGAHGPVERFHVRNQLDEVSGHEPCRQPQVPEQLHHQCRGIAARAAARGERLFGRLHPGLEPNHVLDVARHASIDLDDEIVGAAPVAENGGEIIRKRRGRRRSRQVRRQFAPLIRIVFEGELLRVRSQKEVEGIEHGHFHDQIDFNLEFARRVRKHQPRQIIGLRILPPVDEMAGGLHLERVRQNPGSAMRRRAQPDHLRAQAHRPVIPIVGDVIQSNVDRHETSQDANCMAVGLDTYEPHRAPIRCTKARIPSGGAARPPSV